jgi:DNA repair exonuclease SbcCD ATPase subunit
MQTTHRIVQLTAANVKRLKAISITPQTNVVRITGRNGQGKTSVLDSIAMALGGGNEIPTKPIRQGADSAKVVLDLGDIVVRRTFTKAGGSTLTIEDSEGNKVQSPQAVLDRLAGKLTFDPLAFVRLKGDAQAMQLRKLVGLDFKDIDAKRVKVFEDRTVVNREVERLRALVTSMIVHPDTPETEVSSVEILGKLEDAQKANAECDVIINAVKGHEENVTNARSDLKDVTEELESVRKRLTELEKELPLAQQSLALYEKNSATAKELAAAQKKIDLDPIRAELTGLDSKNAKVRANAARAAHVTAGKAARAKADALTTQLDNLDAEKQKLLETAKFPIEGLSFDEVGVTFNKIPFDQASAAEQMRVSVAIAAAMNPNLRVMLVRDGSLLDDTSMELLEELAAKYDLQVWIERVGKDERASVVIEDGEVEGHAVETETETATVSAE